MKKFLVGLMITSTLSSCKLNDPVEESQLQRVVANDQIESILDGLKFKQDPQSVGGLSKFKNNHVVVFYVDGLIRSVMEDMARHGDRYIRYKKDGTRFYYTKEMVMENPLDRGMLWGDHDKRRVREIKRRQGLSGIEAEDYYIRTEYLKLNHINKYFLNDGLRFTEAYTVLPSLTIPANGSMWTGMATDRHTIKSQAAMDRKRIGSWAKEEGNYTLSQLSTVRYEPSQPIKNYELVTETGATPTIMDYLRHTFIPRSTRIGRTTFGYSAVDFIPSLPIHPSMASASFTAGYANGSLLESSPNMDAANFEAILNTFNTRYFGASKKYPKLMVLWMPNTDHLSHGESHRILHRNGFEDFAGYGQYGPSLRLELKRMDQIIGEVIHLYKRRDLYKDTTFILTADHGHLGGSSYKNDLYHANNNVVLLHPENTEDQTQQIRREAAGMQVEKAFRNKRWSIAGTLSSALKTNALLPALKESREESVRDYLFDDKEVDDQDLVAIDNEGFGHAKVYLPYQSAYSRDWKKRNTLDDLRNYEGGKTHVATINGAKVRTKKWDLIRSMFLYPKDSNDVAAEIVVVPRYEIKSHELCSGDARMISVFKGEIDSQGRGERDLLLYQTDLLHCVTSDRYFYDITPGGTDANGRYFYDNVFGFKNHPRSGLSADDWFKYSISSNFPDAMNLLFRDAFNRSRTELPQSREDRYGPDFIVYAKEGWNFRANLIESTDHGYATKGSLNVPMMFHGPKLTKKGISKTPVRVTDLTPTILKLLGVTWDESVPWFDGIPIKEAMEGAVR